MNATVEKALRALADAGIGGPSQQKAVEQNLPVEPRPQSPVLLDAVLTARHPASALCRAALDANPAARKMTTGERRSLAEGLEGIVLAWLSEVLRPEFAWDATCPRGHHIRDGVFVRTLAGWVCDACKQVYASGDCKLLALG
ncbi:MAG: hypothetical protein HY316_09730 [Acidobacteria bacterium]|nr:hypothetical protein [Acidobacteriota bacterium]